MKEIRGTEDGTNPLGFLSCLGALRVMSLALPNHKPTLKWEDGKPVFGFSIDLSEDELIDAIFKYISENGFGRWLLGDLPEPNAMTAEEFSKRMRNGNANDKAFLPCLVTDMILKKKICLASSLVMFSGGGNRKFLGAVAKPKSKKPKKPKKPKVEENSNGRVRQLVLKVGRDHVRDWLIGSGTRMDNGHSLFLLEDEVGAKGSASRWGSNRMALEAFPLYPMVKRTNGLGPTSGFLGYDFIWPIWDDSLNINQVSKLVTSPLICTATPPTHLPKIGIQKVLTARRNIQMNGDKPTYSHLRSQIKPLL